MTSAKVNDKKVGLGLAGGITVGIGILSGNLAAVIAGIILIGKDIRNPRPAADN